MNFNGGVGEFVMNLGGYGGCYGGCGGGYGGDVVVMEVVEVC
jgi:hypothetical protein